MLSLERSLRSGSYTAYREFDAAAGAATLVLYVVPDQPQLAIDADGGPILDLSRYRHLAHVDRPGWGSLMLAVDLGWRDEDEEALCADLASQLGAAVTGKTIELRPLPIRSGTVELVVAGETGSGSEDEHLVSAVVGGGPLTLAATQRAHFLATLSADGAEALWNALDQGRSALFARYELCFEHRLKDVSVRIWADLSGMPAGDANSDVDRVDHLLAQSLAGVELVDEGQPLEPAARSALLASAMNALRGYVEGARDGGPAQLRATWTSDEVLTCCMSLEGALAVSLSDEQRATRMHSVTVAPGLFSVVDVAVMCPPLPDDGPVRAVSVTLSHGDRSESFAFAGDGGRRRFRVQRAEGACDSARAVVSVHYRGEAEPMTLPPTTVDAGGVLVLDAERIGVMPIELALGRVYLDDFAAADVRIEIPELAIDHRVALDAAHPRARWLAVTRRVDPPAARFRVTWLRTGGAAIERPWEPLGAHTRYLDSPGAEQRAARLVAIAAGELSGVTKLIVEVRTIGDAETTHVCELTTSGEEREIPILVTKMTTAYEYRLTVVYADGEHRTDPWRSSDSPVLVVRDRTLISVVVDPQLIDFGGAWLLARVELRHVDPDTGAEQRGALTLMKPSEPATWQFRARDPEHRSWEHRVTLVAAGGDRHTGDWERGHGDVLVLTPPPRG